VASGIMLSSAIERRSDPCAQCGADLRGTPDQYRTVRCAYCGASNCVDDVKRENNIRPLAKVHFATEVTEKKRVLRGFPQRSLCTLWLLMQEINYHILLLFLDLELLIFGTFYYSWDDNNHMSQALSRKFSTSSQYRDCSQSDWFLVFDKK